MGTEVAVAMVSAVIAGVFQLIGQRMDFAYGGGATSPAPPVPGQPPAAAPTFSGINFGLALRQVGILQLVINLVGFVVGIAMGSVGSEPEAAIIAVLFIGTLLLIGGFVWVAMSVSRAAMWPHLSTVALGVAVITVVINAIIFQVSLEMFAFMFALAQTFISMGIGGAIANKIRT